MYVNYLMAISQCAVALAFYLVTGTLLTALVTEGKLTKNHVFDQQHYVCYSKDVIALLIMT